jgi:hypothetical protein
MRGKRNLRQRPRRLYKYRAFSNWSLDMLVLDQLYFSDPSTFNDPLDSRPSLKADLEPEELEQLVIQMAEHRLVQEMQGQAKSIGYGSLKTLEHIQRRSRRKIQYKLSELRYLATDPERNERRDLKQLLARELQDELMRQYTKGIFSMAERPDCPLMWSHYGDQHKGICVGYSVPADATKSLHQISYGGSRSVSARDVRAMVAGDEIARKRVDRAVLCTKAEDWRYEHEWRLIGERGSSWSRLEMKEIVFGLKCSTSVRHAIINALERRSKPVKFFEIREKDGTFDLYKRPSDHDELLSRFPLRSRDVLDEFKPIRQRRKKA